MVKLDQELISGARECATDSRSAHDVQELIYAYQLAVMLHNQQGIFHVNYLDKEHALRVYVAKQKRCSASEATQALEIAK